MSADGPNSKGRRNTLKITQLCKVQLTQTHEELENVESLEAVSPGGNKVKMFRCAVENMDIDEEPSIDENPAQSMLIAVPKMTNFQCKSSKPQSRCTSNSSARKYHFLDKMHIVDDRIPNP